MGNEATLNQNQHKKNVEWILFAVYAFLLILINCFHEPWYDEAEAWQMARGASIRDLLFYVPHYEGHPSLWYLILAIPAKLGVPYELGLKFFNVIAALLYGWLIFMRSPFPKWLRWSLPFHYFLFYQYGVISRPYGLSVLCFLFMAMAYRERNEKPWKFLLPMAFLCMLSGYGIVLAGGICLAWVWDICREKNWKFFSVSFWKDARVLGLFLLLVVAVLVILQIMPKADTYATAMKGYNTLLERLIYTLFVMLPDCTVLTVLEGAAYLSRARISLAILLVGILIGALFLFLLFALSSRKNRHYFFVPYLLFGIFSACVYFCAHHMGMIFAFTIFWLWIALEDEDRWATLKKFQEKSKLSEQDKKTIGTVSKLGMAVLVIMPLYWTVAASFLEITTEYYYGRETAKFLKETGLYKLNVMAEYDISIPRDIQDFVTEKMDYVNTEIVARPVAILPYFEHNFVKNLNFGRDEEGYVLHRIPTREENENTLAKWKEMGAPDVIIDEMDLSLVFGKEVKKTDYVRVYQYAPAANIWKAFPSKYNIVYQGYIYVRKELAEEYHLEVIE